MSDQPNMDRRTFVSSALAGLAVMGVSGLAGATPSGVGSDRAALRQVVEANNAAAIARLQEWISIPTIAADGLNLDLGVEHMMKLARDAGFQSVRRIPTDGVDGVFATLDVGAPRWLGIYFMYDVIEFKPEDWTIPPLEARIIDKPPYGKVVVGRGAKNQKGPQNAFLAALHAFHAAGQTLPVNVALVCEGEEEIGSPHFRQIISHPEVQPVLRRCEGLYVPGPFQDGSTGAITVPLGAKGPLNVQLVVDGARSGVGPASDIHSSEKGRVDSPILRLVQAVSSLTSADGNTPTLDGFLDDVRPLGAREKELIAELARNTSEEEIMRRYGITHWIDGASYQQSIERLLSQPTINVQGLVGGYAGPGSNTILPSRAEAKLDFRLVPNQTVERVVEQLRDHLDKRGFTDVEIKQSGSYDPTETAENSRIVQAALAAYRAAGVPVSVSPRLAGSWPGSMFTSPPLSIPAIPFGLGFGANDHAPDEFLVLESANPGVSGYVEATMGYVDVMHAVAQAD